MSGTELGGAAALTPPGPSRPGLLSRGRRHLLGWQEGVFLSLVLAPIHLLPLGPLQATDPRERISGRRAPCFLKGLLIVPNAWGNVLMRVNYLKNHRSLYNKLPGTTFTSTETKAVCRGEEAQHGWELTSLLSLHCVFKGRPQTLIFSLGVRSEV